MPLTKIQSLGITDGAIVAADIASGAITAAKLASGVGGKVLQVVTATYSTNTDVTSTSYVDSGLTASITPSSASSKIYVATCQSIFGYINANSPRKFYYQLVRTSTTIAEKFMEIEAGTGSRNINIECLDGNFSCLDSPSTTSSVTYKTQGKLDSNASSSVLKFNSDNALGTIVLMEIAG